MKIVKQNKIFYYIKGFSRAVFPVGSYKNRIKILENNLSESQLSLVKERVCYYNKIENKKIKPVNGTFVKDLKKPVTPKSYFFDTYEYARFFSDNFPLDFLFGDVITVPPTPSIVKSRPIFNENENSVLLNLDKARHFVFVKEDKDFFSKKDLMIGRCTVSQPHRYEFFNKYFGNPLVDLAQVNTAGGNPDWYQPKISIEKHLDFKFILSLQGNDVATNLKWIMSSNSIAVMPKPTLETWFMEGTLEGGKHYIEIKPDYSDLEEQLKFYITNPNLCLQIIENAHQYCEKFFNKNMEDLCSLLVLEKYFENIK